MGLERGRGGERTEENGREGGRWRAKKREERRGREEGMGGKGKRKD